MSVGVLDVDRSWQYVLVGVLDVKRSWQYVSLGLYTCDSSVALFNVSFKALQWGSFMRQ